MPTYLNDTTNRMDGMDSMMLVIITDIYAVYLVNTACILSVSILCVPARASGMDLQAPSIPLARPRMVRELIVYNCN